MGAGSQDPRKYLGWVTLCFVPLEMLYLVYLYESNVICAPHETDFNSLARFSSL